MTIADLKLRHSQRVFSDKPLSENIINRLRSLITDINTHEAGVRFELVIDDPKPFNSLLKSYGMFRNVKNYIACVVDHDYPYDLQRAGYYGEKLLMNAFCMGLGTCFVGGTYNSDRINVRIRIGEELLFLIVLGHESDRGESITARLTQRLSHLKKLDYIDYLVTKLPMSECFETFPLLKEGLEAIACAPSALNKRPTRIAIQRINACYELTLYVPTKNKRQLIDLGIAMFNFEVAYPGEWQWGNPAKFYPGMIT